MAEIAPSRRTGPVRGDGSSPAFGGHKHSKEFAGVAPGFRDYAIERSSLEHGIIHRVALGGRPRAHETAGLRDHGDLVCHVGHRDGLAALGLVSSAQKFAHRKILIVKKVKKEGPRNTNFP